MIGWANFAAIDRALGPPQVNGIVSLSALLTGVPWSGGSSPVLLWIGVSALVILIAWRDLTSYTIPDSAVLILLVLATVDRMTQPIFVDDATFGAVNIFLDAAVAGASVLLVRELYYWRRGHDGIGLGDVKLSAAGAALSGLYGFSIALFVASVVGLCVALVLRRLKLAGTSGKLPFGVILAPAILLVWTVHA